MLGGGGRCGRCGDDERALTIAVLVLCPGLWSATCLFWGGARSSPTARQPQGESSGQAYKQREGLLELGDLLLGERISLGGRVSGSQQTTARYGRVLQGGVCFGAGWGPRGAHTPCLLLCGVEGQRERGSWSAGGRRGAGSGRYIVERPVVR